METLTCLQCGRPIPAPTKPLRYPGRPTDPVDIRCTHCATEHPATDLTVSCNVSIVLRGTITAKVPPGYDVGDFPEAVSDYLYNLPLSAVQLWDVEVELV